jgi:hypothetical protein
MEMNGIKKRNRLIVWLPVFVILLIAIFCRFRFNFFQSTISGDGAYYLLQVRGIIEHGWLAFPDMPLYFYFNAFIAKILIWLHLASPENAIILTIKIVDSIIPPLSAVFVFLLAKKINGTERQIKFHDYLLTAFAVLFFPFILFVSGELQKNAIGIALIFLYLLTVFTFLKQDKKKPLILIVILILTAFTHFGSFTIMLLFTLLLFLFYYITNKKLLKITNNKTLWSVVIILISIFLAIFIFDVERAKRLLSVPFQIFNNPLIAFWMSGQQPFDPLTNLYIFIVNLFCIIAFIIITVNRKSVDNVQKCFAYSLIVLGLILASPLINIEWTFRLHIFAFIPLPILYLIIFKLQLSKIIRVVFIVLFSFMLIHSLRIGLVAHRKPPMSKEAYIELQTMKDKVCIKNNSVTVTRLFLGWWFAWELKTHVSQDYALTRQDFKKYSAIYILRQINVEKTKNLNILDYEIEVPDSSKLVYRGNNFELYELDKNFNWKEMPHVAPLIAGEVENIANGQFSINDGRLNYIIEYNPKLNNLKKGERVKIWGKGQPFSTHVKATTIIQL